MGSWMHARSFTYSNENRVLTGHSASLEVKILNYDDLHKTLDKNKNKKKQTSDVKDESG